MILWAFQGPNGQVTDLTGTDGVDETGVAGSWMPEYELLTREVPGGSGEVLEATRAKPRTVTVPLVVQDPTGTQSSRALDDRLRRLADELAPEDGEGLLLATRADDDGRALYDPETGQPLTRQLRAVYAGGMELTRSWGDQTGGWWQLAGLVFHAAQPYYQSRQARLRTFRTSPPVPWFPFLPLVLGSDSLLGESIEVNDGAVPAYPVWTIRAPGESFTATLLDTGETLTIDTSQAGGQAVTVDTRPTYLGGGRTAQLADGTNVYDRLSGGLWAIPRGPARIMLNVAGGVPGTTEVDLTYAPLYRTP